MEYPQVGRIAKERAARDEKESEVDKDSAGPKPDTSTHEERVWALREHFHVLVKLQKEFVARVRSLRYFVHVSTPQAYRRWAGSIGLPIGLLWSTHM